MYANITGETPIAALTVSQFVDLLDKHKSAPAAPSAPARNYTQGYAYGLKGMDMIIARTTHTLPNYGTWKYMYLVATDEKWIDMVIGESPGGTTLVPNYPSYPGAFMDGIAFRSA